MRVLVCGSRDYANRKLMWSVLDALLVAHPDLTIIEGEARGADRMAREWAEAQLPPVKVLKFPANWNKYGRAAGPIRNRQMLVEGQPDMVLAFGGRDGKGTNNMVQQARKAGLKPQEYER